MHEGKEGGKWLAPPKVKTNVGEALIEASDEVEDEGPIRDNLAEGAKIGGHPLEMPSVIRNGHITLGEAAELGVEVEGSRLTVARNCVSTASQASRVETVPAETVLARSSEMD
jgi:hypothetical protein